MTPLKSSISRIFILDSLIIIFPCDRMRNKDRKEMKRRRGRYSEKYRYGTTEKTREGGGGERVGRREMSKEEETYGREGGGKLRRERKGRRNKRRLGERRGK